MEKQVDEMKNNITQLQFQQKASQEKIADMDSVAKDNRQKISETHALVSSIDKSLAVFCERAAGSAATTLAEHKVFNDKLEDCVARIGGVEDCVAEHELHIEKLILQHEQASKLREEELSRKVTKEEKKSDRKWSAAVLVPYTLITALVTTGVTVAFQAFTPNAEVKAIKQSHIDKLQRQLDDLKKRNT